MSRHKKHEKGLGPQPAPALDNHAGHGRGPEDAGDGGADDGAKSVRFEIEVTATTDWPPSCSGVRPVIEAVQRLLEAAAAGNSGAFLEATAGIGDAVGAWYGEAFGPAGVGKS